MRDVIFVHGMFQNPKSWAKWVGFFGALGYSCKTPAWPFHNGEPKDLRKNVPAGLGTLHLQDVIDHLQPIVARLDKPIMIGHSVGGLLTQIFLNRGLLSCGVAIDSVAPNRMLGLDEGLFKNIATITDPSKGDEPGYMDAPSFRGSFANTLSEEAVAVAFENYVTHDSRNVLRDCLGEIGRIDLAAPHAPLLLIGGEKDEIIPAPVSEKNAQAYTDAGSVTAYRAFPNRSHYICGEPGWEEVAKFAANWVRAQA